jgi:group I intron endonuclease
MRYTIYKVTNTLNGKFYIGKHQTMNPNDSYYGSGRAIVNAMRLYGKEFFRKEILFDFDTEEEMNLKERELVTLDLVSNPKCYNLGIGGEGGPHFKGRKHTSEALAKMVRVGYKHSTETKAKISEANFARTRKPETGERIAAKAKGRKHSPETKAKIAETLRKRHAAEQPRG